MIKKRPRIQAGNGFNSIQIQPERQGWKRMLKYGKEVIT